MHNLFKRILTSHTLKSKNKTTEAMTTNDLERETRNLRLNDPDLAEEANGGKHASKSPSSSNSRTETSFKPYRFIPLRMGGRGGSHVVSEGSASLMEEVALDDLKNMTETFYTKAFKDPTLDKFIRSHNDPHGSRFAKWIHQKLSGSTVWDQDRRQRDRTPVTLAGGRTHVVNDRSSAHVAAWYSAKRPAREVGRHFKLDESRVWMRLHFWALRESGMLAKSPTFADYYVRFIGHFVSVYESSAPMFARDSFRWSADPANIAKYKKEGLMTDVLGLSLEEAETQIPEEEANDFNWPYNQTPVPQQQ